MGGHIRITTPSNVRFRHESKDGAVSGTLEWNHDFGGNYTQSFRRAQMYVDSEVIRLSDPLVPKDEGILKGSAVTHTNVGSGFVIYSTPYARNVYYTHKNYKGAPQRGSRWFERMKIRHRADILRGAKRIAGGR